MTQWLGAPHAPRTAPGGVAQSPEQGRVRLRGAWSAARGPPRRTCGCGALRPPRPLIGPRAPSSCSTRATVSTVVVANAPKKVDVTKQGLNSVKDDIIRNNLQGKSRKMGQKGWVDPQGREGKVRRPRCRGGGRREPAGGAAAPGRAPRREERRERHRGPDLRPARRSSH